MYPNLVAGIVRITFGTKYSTDVCILIYDVLGNVVLEKDYKNEEFEINISEIPTGIYFVSIKGGKTILKTKKLLVK